MAKATDVEGMEKSIMPLRYMHTLDAVGKGISLECDDVAKQIKMGFEVVDPLTIKKIRKGVLGQLSQGGAYVKTWKSKGVKYYTANPGEVSVVDLASCPSALIQSVKSPASFQLTKADGVTVDIPFRHEACQCPCAECVEGDCDECLTPECDSANCDCPNKVVSAKAFQVAISSAVEAAVAKALPALVEKLKKAEQVAAPEPTPEQLAKDAKTKRVAGEDLPASAFAWAPDPQDPSNWKLPIHFSSEAKSKRHCANALARFSQTQGIPEDKKAEVKEKIEAAAKKYGITVADAEKAYAAAEVKLNGMIKSSVEAKCKPLAKGLWDVGEFASLCARLQSLLFGLIWERDVENDDSIVPDDLQGHIEGLLDTLVAYVGEEVEEAKQTAAAANKGATTNMDKNQLLELLKAATDGELLGADLFKAASLAAHFKKSAAHNMAKAKTHEAMAKCHGDSAEAMKAETGELQKSSHSFHKAMMAHHEKHAELHKAFAAHATKMAEKCGDTEKAADGNELSKGVDMDALFTRFEATLEKTVKPLQDEIALLKAKQIVDPGASTTDVNKRAKLFPVPRADGNQPLEKAAPNAEGDFDVTDLYAVGQ